MASLKTLSAQNIDPRPTRLGATQSQNLFRRLAARGLYVRAYVRTYVVGPRGFAVISADVKTI